VTDFIQKKEGIPMKQERAAKVVVLPYDAAWKCAFEAIRSEIADALGALAIGIEHVGSTSVEGLSAKPCIDVDVVIRDRSDLDAVVRRLGAIGYFHEGDLGIKDREAFKYSDKPHLMKHHLYVCPQNSKELQRHLTFRDFLRSNREAAGKYSAVKETAAKLFPDDMDGYIAYKSPCIEDLYKRCGLKNDEAYLACAGASPDVGSVEMADTQTIFRG
jgi:GrpB-like predicted nucleotidyltransferase (UPF0157 family)